VATGGELSVDLSWMRKAVRRHTPDVVKKIAGAAPEWDILPGCLSPAVA
jgi:hypothetical protein